MLRICLAHLHRLPPFIYPPLGEVLYYSPFNHKKAESSGRHDNQPEHSKWSVANFTQPLQTRAAPLRSQYTDAIKLLKLVFQSLQWALMSCVDMHGGFVLGRTGVCFVRLKEKDFIVALCLCVCVCVCVCECVWTPRRGRNEADWGQVHRTSDARQLQGACKCFQWKV